LIKKTCKYCNESGKEPIPISPKSVISLTLTIDFSVPSICSVCKGKGFNLFDCEENDLIECKGCNGTGRLENGIVKTIFNKCDSCNGKGFIDLHKIESNYPCNFWQLIDERIIAVAKPRFENNLYADAVEAAFKELNSVIKSVVLKKTDIELDGKNLMEKAFSLDKPIIRLKNIQKGFLQIFSGAMTGIRNPKAHSNIDISKELSIHYLFLASLLISMISEE
jgi:uncharacterized protein (TIGR02391 family)